MHLGVLGELRCRDYVIYVLYLINFMGFDCFMISSETFCVEWGFVVVIRAVCRVKR